MFSATADSAFHPGETRLSRFRVDHGGRLRPVARSEFVRRRSCCALPIASVKEKIDRPIAPDQDVLSASAEGTVQPAGSDPLVDGFKTQPEKLRELSGRENRRELGSEIAIERSGNLFARQVRIRGAHVVSTLGS